MLQNELVELKNTTSVQTELKLNPAPEFSSVAPDQVHALTNRVSDLESELMLLKESSHAKIKKLKSKIRDLTKLLEALQTTSALGPKPANQIQKNLEQSSGAHLLGNVPENPLRLTEESMVSLPGHYELKTEFWPNNQMKFQGKIHTVAFCKHGNCMEWYENGALKSEEEMMNGFRHGWCQDFYDNGGPRLKGWFVGGTLCGTGTQFRANGCKIYEGEYKDDKRWGKGYCFHENGVVEYEGDWVAGKKWGQGKLCSKNGQVISAGVFADDKFTGQKDVLACWGRNINGYFGL